MRTAIAILSCLIFCCLTSYGQNKYIEYSGIQIDTLEKNKHIVQDVVFEIKNHKMDKLQLFKILKATAVDKNNSAFSADDFYSDKKYTYDKWLRASFIQGRKKIPLVLVKGKIRYFYPSVENGSVVLKDSVLQHLDTIIYNNNNLKIAAIDLKKLKAAKDHGRKQYRKAVETIINRNQLNGGLLKDALKNVFDKNFIAYDELIIYAEDPDDVVDAIDSLDANPNFEPAKMSGGPIKIFFFNRKNASNNARILIENSSSIEDSEFGIQLNGS